MKKLAVMLVLVLSATLASAAFAADLGETMVGNLFLFQKCDPSLIPDAEAENPQFDANGCPLPGNGPWPIFPDNRRWAKMRYNLLGDKFRFSVQGNRLVPETDHTLIYYPDAWPGLGLICLGNGTSNPGGNLQIHGSMEILSGLPAPYDQNFNPVEPSGASGAKIWLVPSADVKCEGTGDVVPETGLPSDPAQMLAWNPASYLFEGNLIVYQYSAAAIEDDEDDTESDVEGFGPNKKKAGNPNIFPMGNGGSNAGNGRGKKDK